MHNKPRNVGKHGVDSARVNLISWRYFNVFSLLAIECFSSRIAEDVLIKFWYVTSSHPLNDSRCRAKGKQHLRKSPTQVIHSTRFLPFNVPPSRWFLASINRISTCSQQPRGDEGHFPCACVCFVEFLAEEKLPPARIVCARRRREIFPVSEKILGSRRRFFTRESWFWRFASPFPFTISSLMYKAFPDGSLGLVVL